MKTKFFLPLCFLFLVCFNSCKKKTTEELVSTGTGNSMSNLSNCYGEIYFQENTAISQGTASVVKSPVEARFYASPITDSQKQDLDVGNVIINNITLKRYGGAFTNRFYGDSTNQLFSLPAFTLSASGSSVTTKFGFQYGFGSPAFADTNLIPSIVKRSQGIYITFRNVSNSDSLVFSLERDYYQNVTRTVFTRGLTEVNVKITREEIVDLMQSYIDATVRITVFKKVLIHAGNKDYLVHFRKVYSKPVLVDLL